MSTEKDSQEKCQNCGKEAVDKKWINSTIFYRDHGKSCKMKKNFCSGRCKCHYQMGYEG